MTEHDIDQLATTIFTAIETGDAETISAMWAADVGVWHNTDDVVQTKEQNLRTLQWMIDAMDVREYRQVRRTCTASGFTQRHVLHLEWGDRTFDLPAALFVEIRDGKVSHIDEYLDGTAVTAAFGG